MNLRTIPAALTLVTCVSAAELWSLKPVVRPEPPGDRARNPIDAFIRENHVRKGLQPLGKADKATLIRRVSLDLIGLPPTPAEVRAFLEDPSPDAYEKVVDRLLTSEQFGVRYGRLWLDVLRYTDLDSSNPAATGMWHWRDWVISAINRDYPYDKFMSAQIAGDLSERADDIFGTGFLSRSALSQADSDHELAFGAIETIGTAFMGMTIGCARCHDHRFDPIKQREVYAMKALFDPLVLDRRVLATADQTFAYAAAKEKWQQDRAVVEKEIDALAGATEKALFEERVLMLPPAAQTIIRKPAKDRTPEERKIADDYSPVLRIDPPKILEQLPEADRPAFKALRKKLAAIKEPAELPIFWTVREDPKRLATKSHILDTGDPARPKEEVEPGFPFAPPNADFTVGRRQAFLAWLTDEKNPLVARVAVNRMWQWHFGEGIVPTSGDFGLAGDRPTNLKLLDWLAAEFVARKFSMKAMHRLMVTSDAYQMASVGDSSVMAANATIDPRNTYLTRFRLRRVDAETARDLIYSLAGNLDLSIGGRSFREGPPQFWLGSDDKEMGDYDTRTNRRAAYMGRGYHQDRDMLPGFLQTFDAEDGRRTCTRRNSTVTPPQALTMMNSQMIVDASRLFGQRLASECGNDLAKAIDTGYLAVISRPPTTVERDHALTYLDGSTQRLGGFAWLLLNLDEFLYVR